MSETVQIITDYGPDTEEEVELKRQLIKLQKRYAKEAKPLADRLMAIRAARLPKIFCVPK